MRYPDLLNILSIMTMGLMISASAIAANEPNRAVADNGREVILNENGEWEYVNDDIFATTPDGQRVRLKSDGQWQRVSEVKAPVYQPAPITTVSRDSVAIANSDSTISLDQVVIENHRESVGKNTRKRSNLVFYIEDSNSSGLPRPDSIRVQDSKGRDYPVISVSNGVSILGSQPRIVIRAKGAPRWWGVKFFSLQIAPGTFGNEKAIDLRKPMSDVLSKEVAELPEDDS